MHYCRVGVQTKDVSETLDVQLRDSAGNYSDDESVFELKDSNAEGFDEVQKKKVVYLMVLWFGDEICVFRPRSIFKGNNLNSSRVNKIKFLIQNLQKWVILSLTDIDSFNPLEYFFESICPPDFNVFLLIEYSHLVSATESKIDDAAAIDGGSLLDRVCVDDVY